MAHYVEDNRCTQLFVSGSLETLLPGDAVARTIRSALAQLDFSSFDEQYFNDAAGRRALDPRSLVAVWILALLRGETSSVRLAVLCGQDIEFRWLLGDAPVQKSTLCAFRKDHYERIASLGSQVLMALGQCGYLPGERLGVDGTVVRAASSRHAVRTRKGLARQVERVEALLRERLSEEDSPASRKEDDSLLRKERKLTEALERMDALGLSKDKDRLTITEPCAKLLRQKDGSYAPGYNVQTVPDLHSGAIIHAEVSDAGNDGGQLQPQIERAEAVLEAIGTPGKGQAPPDIAADGAYHDTHQIVGLEKKGIVCYVPEIRNSNRQSPDATAEYQADAFVYDDKTDTIVCPQGQRLRYRKLNNTQTSAVYQAPAAVCADCPAKPHCCPKTKEGRNINRPIYKEELDKVAKRLETDKGSVMKRARWIVCEGVYARLNHLLHWKRCRLWGREGAKAELAWRTFAHNLMLLTGRWKPLVDHPITA
jgi:transposase